MGYAYSMLMDYLWIAYGFLMYARQPANPSVHPTVRPSVHPPVHLSASHPFQAFRPSIHAFGWPSASPSSNLSTHLVHPPARPLQNISRTWNCFLVVRCARRTSVATLCVYRK